MGLPGQDEVVDAQIVVLADAVGDLGVAADERGARTAADQAVAGPQVGEISRSAVLPSCSAVIRCCPTDSVRASTS